MLIFYARLKMRVCIYSVLIINVVLTLNVSCDSAAQTVFNVSVNIWSGLVLRLYFMSSCFKLLCKANVLNVVINISALLLHTTANAEVTLMFCCHILYETNMAKEEGWFNWFTESLPHWRNTVTGKIHSFKYKCLTIRIYFTLCSMVHFKFWCIDAVNC